MIVRELITKLGFSVDDTQVKKYDGMIGKIGAVGKAIGAIGFAASLAGIGKIADDMTNAYTRVGIAAGQANQAEMWEKIYKVAMDTRQPLEDVANTYGKIGRNAKDLGINQEEALRVTEIMNKAFIESGASTQEAKSAILQMGQALSSGVLQGDEFRSITENAPLIADAIARGMGIARSELKKAASEGKLTSKEVVKAILSQGAAIDAEFTKFPITIGQSLTVGKNLFAKFISDVDRKTGASNRVARAFVSAFKAIDNEIRYAISYFGGFERVLRRVTLFAVALGMTMASRLVIARVAAMGLTKAITLITGAVMTLVRRFVLLYGLVLILEDIYAWVTNNKSLIGEYMGSWDEFTGKFRTWFDTIILARLKAMKEYISGLIDDVTAFWDKVANGKSIAEGADISLGSMGATIRKFVTTPNNNWMGTDRPLWSPTSSLGGNTQNFSFNIDMPPGTTAQQASYIQGVTQKSSEMAFDSVSRDMSYGVG